MALNAGEVEVLLKLRDELSTQMKVVQTNLRGSTTDAAAAGTAITAMGTSGTKAFQDTAKEAASADKMFSSSIATVKNLALAFGGMYAVHEAVSFVKDVTAEASALRDLSQQTHINVEDLQAMAGAMSEFGVDANTLGKSLYTLSRKIAKGDDSISDALAQMGMSLKDVRGLNGEELFMTIMKGLSKLQGGMRDDTSSEIFGSRLGMAMAGASEDIEGTMKTWKSLNHVMSKETIEALDEADEAIKRNTKSLQMMAANSLGPIAQGINVLSDAADKGAVSWKINAAMAQDAFEAMTGLGTGTEHLTKYLDSLNVAHDAAEKSTKKNTEAHKDFIPVLESTAGATKAAREALQAYEDSSVWGGGSVAIHLSEINNELDRGMETLPAFEGLLVGLVEDFDQLDPAMSAYVESLTRAANYEKAMADGLVIIGQTADQVTDSIKKTTMSFSEAMDAVNHGKGTMSATIQAPKTDAQWKKEATDVGGRVMLDDYNNKYVYVPGQNMPGKAIPGFATGGPTSEGPAYLHDGEYVVPKNGALVGGGSKVFNMTFNIVDTEANIAKRVSDTILRTMMSGAQLAGS